MTRDVIIKKMKTNLHHCHAIIKDEIVLDDGKYLGIDFRLKDDGLTWSHLESNITLVQVATSVATAHKEGISPIWWSSAVGRDRER